MDPIPIPPSIFDLERRRLESTIDNDLHSLSLASLPTSTTTTGTSHSFISTITSGSGSGSLSLEYPRAETRSMSYVPAQPTQSRLSSYNYTTGGGGAGGPEQSMFIGASPVSTAGHHASAVTLGAGVFNNDHGHERNGNDGDSEFDPERSLGRLVGELGRVMGSDRLPTRPSSPFSPPRSPSPLPSLHSQPANLSFTLTRNDPLLSPPSSGENTTIKPSQRPDPSSRTQSQSQSRFSSLARELGNELRASQAAHPSQPRRALSDSTAHNVTRTPAPRKTTNKEKNNRLQTLQDENRRSASAPVRSNRDASADVTGLTALMATPAKGGEYENIHKNGDVGGDAGAAIPQTLAILHARLRALETENSVSRRRVRELEDELERAKSDVEGAKREGGSRLREVIGEKSALEDLVKSLRTHLSRLTVELEQNKALVTELRQLAQVSAARAPSPTHSHSPAVASELANLRHEIERLTKEVERLGGIVEEGLETRKKARGERTIRMEQEEAARFAREIRQEQEQEQESEDVKRARRDMEKRRIALQQQQQQRTSASASAPAEPSRLRQGLHASAAEVPSLQPPTVQTNRTRHVQHPTPPPSDDGSYDSPTPTARSRPVSRQSLIDREREISRSKDNDATRRKSYSRSHRRVSDQVAPSSPFPSIIGDELEKEFFSPLREKEKRKSAQNVRIASRSSSGSSSGKHQHARHDGDEEREVPPQSILSRVVSELEDDFAHYKVIYAELADQYKLLDPASVSAKRHVLADHLKEVIDTLEQKADQISSLYDLLSFADKPSPVSYSSKSGAGTRRASKNVGDVMRMVRESLGEQAWERLECDLGKKWRM